MESVSLLYYFTCGGFFVYKWILIAAIVLTWISADPFNPIVQWVNKVSRPLWNWCHNWLPSRLKFYDAYFALMVVIFLQVLIPASIEAINNWSQTTEPVTVLVREIGGFALQGLCIVAETVLMFFMVLFAFWFFISLVTPSPVNPVVRILYALVDPFLTPIQRYLPRSNIDLSPLVAIGICLLTMLFIIRPIFYQALVLSGGGGICTF